MASAAIECACNVQPSKIRHLLRQMSKKTADLAKRNKDVGLEKLLIREREGKLSRLKGMRQNAATFLQIKDQPADAASAQLSADQLKRKRKLEELRRKGDAFLRMLEAEDAAKLAKTAQPETTTQADESATVSESKTNVPDKFEWKAACDDKSEAEVTLRTVWSLQPSETRIRDRKSEERQQTSDEESHQTPSVTTTCGGEPSDGEKARDGGDVGTLERGMMELRLAELKHKEEMMRFELKQMKIEYKMMKLSLWRARHLNAATSRREPSPPPTPARSILSTAAGDDSAISQFAAVLNFWRKHETSSSPNRRGLTRHRSRRRNVAKKSTSQHVARRRAGHAPDAAAADAPVSSDPATDKAEDES